MTVFERYGDATVEHWPETALRPPLGSATTPCDPNGSEPTSVTAQPLCG
ncbi:MAG TPA: hypothetical protein VFW65_00865 [Pseudonocardiaceae bacterium]|nr:hypothetical protein [Pseudonocardiaceae bacterium]